LDKEKVAGVLLMDCDAVVLFARGVYASTAAAATTAGVQQNAAAAAAGALL
jgi:hypothetical protein